MKTYDIPTINIHKPWNSSSDLHQPQPYRKRGPGKTTGPIPALFCYIIVQM